jgi:hypothetical protein
LEEGRPVRLSVDDIESITDTVKLGLAAGDTAALAVEQKLRPIVRHFPGA